MKKLIKTIAGFLVIVVLVGIMSNYSADKYVMAATKAKVEFNDVNVIPGGEFEITGTFYYSKGVGGYQLKIPYNKEQFEFVSGKTVAKATQFNANNMGDSVNIVAILSNDIATDKETVFKLKFKAKKTAATGSYVVTSSGGELGNASTHESVPYDIKGGHIYVSAIVKGDIDGNGKISITDAMRVFHYVSGRNRAFTDKNTAAADINGDGKVTITDAMKMFHYVSGRIKTLGSNTSTTVIPSGVSLGKTSLTLVTGQTTALTATVSPSNAANKNVIWSSSNTAVATVDANGKVTAKSAGNATITVKTVSGAKTATCVVTVKNPTVAVTGISITQNSEKIYLDAYAREKKQLTCNVQPGNATNKSVTWTSSNTGIATVDANGNVTAVNPGVVTITAKTNDGGFTAKKEIYVYRLKATPPSGTYIIKSKANQGLCIDVENGNMSSGQAVVMYTIHKGPNQQWRFDDYISQYGGYAIVVQAGNLVLDIYRPTNGNMNIDYGDKLDIYDFNDKEAQIWYFVKLWDGSYRIVLNSSDGGGIVTASGNNNGASLKLDGWDWNNPCQEWIFEKVEATAPTDEVTQKINSLRSRYVNGQYWNTYNGLDRTGTTICPCGNATCPATCACNCGVFRYGGQDIAWQCHGYALKMAYEVFGENANTWSKHTNTGSIYAGDVIRLYNNGHSIFVTKVDGDNIYFTDCNWTGRCQVRWEGRMTRSQIASNLTYIAHKSGNNSLGK